ncbi:MAG: hypothetical protein WCP87_02410 [Atribacterota bacterium]|nr:hypothetical protein [Candidatus Atribacteria bacterium]
MKKIRFFLILLTILVLFFSSWGYADSPVTSTPFCETYIDIPLVQQARRNGILTDEMAEFLFSPAQVLGEKAALINALGWDFNGKSNAKRFAGFLMTRYGFQTRKIPLDSLNGDDLFCLGYLTLMDDYFHPGKALPILKKAVRFKRTSFTAHIILAIARAQYAMDSDWCQVWKYPEDVFANPILTLDLREPARKIIYDYLVLYQESCR